MKKDRNSKGKKSRRLQPQNDKHDKNAKHGNSVDGNNPPATLAEAIRARFAPLGGVELELPPREPMRDPPDFMRDPPDIK